MIKHFRPAPWAAFAATFATAALLVGTPLGSSAAAQDAVPQKLELDQSGGTDADPVVVVTLGSLNKMMGDVNYLGSAMGQPQIGGTFGMVVGMMAQGIDMNRPIGMVMPLYDGMPAPIALLPTADVKSVLRRMEAQVGPFEEDSDGTMVVALGPNMAYVKQVGEWAALAPAKELLALAPTDPSEYFLGMGNKYFLAARLKMQKVPAESRAQLVESLRQGFENAMAQQGDNAQGREAAEGTINQLAQLIEETDQLDFGINIDRDNGRVIIDTLFKAVPGTDLANIYSEQKVLPSKFASVVRADAAAYFHTCASVPPTAVEQTKEQLQSNFETIKSALENEDNLTDAQRADLEELFNRLSDIGVRTLEEGRTDIGGVLLADGTQGRFAMGAFVVDGGEVAQLAKDVAEKVKDTGDAPKFFFDESVYNGVTMHRVIGDLKADQDEARKIFGDQVTLHIGTGAKHVYVAVGQGSLDLMKQLIDAPIESTVDPNRPASQFRLQMMPILEYAQSIEANRTIGAMVSALAEANRVGELTVEGRLVANGGRSQIAIGEGLLKAIGSAIAANQPQPQGGF